MLSEADILRSEGRAPLLSTAHLVSADCLFPLADGHYDTPLLLSTGVTYAGGFRGGKLNGHGCLTCERGAYSGSFVDNVLQGEATFRSQRAQGPLPQSAEESVARADAQPPAPVPPYGSSTTASLTGFTEEALDPTTVASYDGEWCDGVPCGVGCMRWEGGDCYAGAFDRGQPHGSGSAEVVNTFSFADGRVYAGAFDHGLRDGKGRLTQPNGDLYDGQFVRGTVTGFGTLLYARGPRIYRGLFDHGRKVRGYLRFPGSQRGYEGEWQDDVPHGSGCMTFASGDFYRGDFARGELQGVGCLCYQSPAGKVYYGQFLRGQPCGRGFLYEPEEGQGSGEESTPTEPTEAKVTEGVFHHGQVVAATDAELREAVVEATRSLRQPEAAAPAYTALLQLRPAAAALTASFGGLSFTAASAHLAADRAGTPPTLSASCPGLPLYPPSPRQQQSGGRLLSPVVAAAPSLSVVGSGGSLSVPSATFLSGSFARPAPSTVSPRPPSLSADGAGAAAAAAAREESDEEAIVSVSSSEVDVDEAEADNAVLIGRTREDSSASVMPFLDPTAGQDGSCRGWLEKCSIGRSNLSLISNWKRRFFILALCNDSICLGYYEDDGCRKPIGFIRLNTTDTRIVTCPTTKTHKKASRPGRDLCVIYHENRKEYKLLLRARDADDHDRWAAAFRTFFIIVDRPSDFPMHVFQG